MKFIKIALLTLFGMACYAQNMPLKENFQRLPFGSIKPAGWLKVQMQNDIKGFVGNLDSIVPELINDPIYGSGRLHKNSKPKDLGNLKVGDLEGDDQYKWWNSETQSNWRDGYIRNVFLLEDKEGIKKAKKYIEAMLATQDADGYLGIYDTDLRYNFRSENGELWAKATLYRALLAYYEATGDKKVWNALLKAVENVMQHYPINQSKPFDTGTNFNGGVSHGLTFTDVLDRMYQLTNDRKYQAYALFLYNDFSASYQSEKDVQLKSILDENYKLQSHGVHSFEHLRPLIFAAYSNPSLQKALAIYLHRIKNATTLSGGAIGDEWIAGRDAHATDTGYEYCSLHELLDSYTVLLQKTGKASIGDDIENIFYNAAQGARNPQHSCIAYLKTDNSFEMMGTKNGEVEPNRKQIRYKYSPAHQDAAVCCNPNAGRITPYFIQSSWMKENENTLVATLLMPNRLETTIGQTKVWIENQTNYPNENSFEFKISLSKPTFLSIKIRKPQWVTALKTNEKYKMSNDYIVFERQFNQSDVLQFSFETGVRVLTDLQNQKYFAFGARLFAYPIPAIEQKGKEYAKGFYDLTYQPKENKRYQFIENNNAKISKDGLQVQLKNLETNTVEAVKLVPFGKTILRQAAF